MKSLNLIQHSKYGVESGFTTEIILCLVMLILYATRGRFSFSVPRFHARVLSWEAKPSLVNYSDLPQFAKYDLENGFVVDFKEDGSIEFTVDAALTYAHPLNKRTLGRRILDALVRDLPPYQHPPSFAKILIVFPNVRSVRWAKKSFRPTVDLDGTVDYGSIDCFTIEGDKNCLSGQWGDVEIISDPVEVKEIA